MTHTLPTASTATDGAVAHFDAIVIGAGGSGLNQLYRHRELGLAVRCFEDGGERLRGGCVARTASACTQEGKGAHSGDKLQNYGAPRRALPYRRRA